MDIGEFKQRFLPLQRVMYFIAFRVSGSAQEAEDAVQEAFLRLWTSRNRLPQMDSPEAYCTTLVRRICYERHRQKHAQVVSIDTAKPVAPTSDDIEERIDRSQMTAMVKAIIKLLPEQQRLVITLHDVDGHDNSEVAAITGLSEVNVRVILSRARKTVRDRLGIVRS